MCGFSGWVDQNPQSKDVLERMTHSLSHRGPDASGFYCEGAAAFGHRRLSIIDLAESHQPMTSQDGRYVLAYNGELYNFLELKQELGSLGKKFRTQGDTEVVLEALIEWKESALSRFVGMFAFAFWDKQEKRLLLARDHLGVKPLYFYQDSERIVFGSEMKALLEHPAISKEINPNAIGLYLECQYIPAPETMFQKIQKLPAAHYLVYQDGICKQASYWTPQYLPKFDFDEKTAVLLLEEHLTRSVRSMMVADVPLGVFVSGGIDSSMIAALMQKESRQKIHMFSIALNHQDGEQMHAESVAKYLGAHFHPLVVEAKDLISSLDVPLDEPLGDQAILPTLLLSKLTRSSVKVVLTGEGADEILAGYSNYPKKIKDAPICHLLHHSLLPYLYPLMPTKLRKSRLCKAMSRPESRRHATIASLFDRETYSYILEKPFRRAQNSSLEEIAERYYFECNGKNFLDKMLHVDTKLWLADDLLTKVDRATMAYSLEARVPYLDHRLVEFAACLPCEYKLRGFEGKYLLKQLASLGFLPMDIVRRPKKGFVMPLGDWMRGELKPLVDDALFSLSSRQILQKKALKNLRERNQKSDATRLFALLSLELWFRRFAPNYSF